MPNICILHGKFLYIKKKLYFCSAKTRAFMLLILVPKLTNRLGYTLNVVFRTILHVEFEITTDEETFIRHTDAKLCYGSRKVGDAVFVKSVPLLFQTTIETQEPRCFDFDSSRAFFPTYGKDIDLPFDVFAASFYLLSRYEEYLPHHADQHGRFLASESLAFQEGFLRQPIVDRWAQLLAAKISERFPDFQLPEQHLRILHTVDIDAAYCYKHKGLFRTVTGALRDAVARRAPDEVRLRWRVLRGKEADPFDTFDYILDTRHRFHHNKLIFFVLLADYGMYDKNITHHNEDFQQLLQHLGDYAKVGIHTSYASFDNPKKIGIETDRLSKILHRHIVRNRCHFLRLQLPQTYRQLQNHGISHDYTMGYADEPGYRAGTGTPFHFYDLESDYETMLLIHPFAVMDTTLHKYQQQSPDEALQTYKDMLLSAQSTSSTFSCIWHNENLSERFGWEGWRSVFEQVMEFGDSLTVPSSITINQSSNSLSSAFKTS